MFISMTHECKHEYDFGVMATESKQTREDVAEIKSFLLGNGLLQTVAGLKSHVKLLTGLVFAILPLLVYWKWG